MSDAVEKGEHDIEIGEKIKVSKGEYKGEEGNVINIYNNTIAVEFMNILTKDGSKFRTVVRHENYNKVK
jgi:ribosomal protein L24